MANLPAKVVKLKDGISRRTKRQHSNVMNSSKMCCETQEHYKDVARRKCLNESVMTARLCCEYVFCIAKLEWFRRTDRTVVENELDSKGKSLLGLPNEAQPIYSVLLCFVVRCKLTISNDGKAMRFEAICPWPCAL